MDHNPRIFKIFPTGSVADPAHLAPLIEMVDNTPIMYSNFEVLKNYIHDIELNDAKNAGYNKSLNEVLSTLGVTRQEYIRIYNTNLEEDKRIEEESN